MAPYPFPSLTRPGSLFHTMMHLYSPYVLMILMCTGYWLILAARLILQLPVFRQINIFLDRLSSAGRILYGFNGATTVTMGDITFPVRVGPVVQQVLFSIVEDLGPYNAIVGRALLHAMKVVPSTYHQMISYLTSAGQVDLLSSQLAAR